MKVTKRVEEKSLIKQFVVKVKIILMIVLKLYQWICFQIGASANKVAGNLIFCSQTLLKALSKDFGHKKNSH